MARSDHAASDMLINILQKDQQILDLQVKIPTAADRVFKDECVFTYETPESEHGLYICMRTFLGIGRPVIDKYCEITNQRLFVRHQRIRKPIIPAVSQSSPKTDENGELKPKRLAIGVEGGFQPDAPQHEFEDNYAVVLWSQNIAIRLPNNQLPDKILQCVAGICAADAASRVAEAKGQQATWDGEFRVESKHFADLLQLPPNGRVIPPGPNWTCEHWSGCNVNENLWLNLSDGMIFCGRKMWDGSGGNNHALEHYNENKNFPLAVKLGTITPEGNADVYSYAEDDMVLDPMLAVHLAHWGINTAQMKKTEKTMVELEIEWNQKIGEWTKMTESDTVLQDVYGPGYTGMENLGNSCYMNSVMQVMFSLEPFVDVYANPLTFDRICFGPEAVLSRTLNGAKSIPDDFLTQLAKLGNGLTSGFYSKPPPPASDANNASSQNNKQVADSGRTVVDQTAAQQQHRRGIRPLMFKNVIGKDHRDFSTKQQQDAYEFFLHLLHLTESSNVGRATPGDLFKFEWQIKTQCMESCRVRYSKRLDNAWSLPIHMEDAINKTELDGFESRRVNAEARGEKLPDSEHVRATVPLNACIRRFMEDSIIDDFYSTAVKRKVAAVQATRFASFPKYLLLRLERYVMGADWTAKKLDVSVHVPDTLDLEDRSIIQGSLRGTRVGGVRDADVIASDEQLLLLPEETEDDRRIMREQGELDRQRRQAQQQQQQRDTTAVDEAIVNELTTNMGFPIGASRKAVFTTKGPLEAATNWIMEHMDDADFYDDWQPPSAVPPVAADHQSSNTGAVVSTATTGAPGASAADEPPPPSEQHIHAIIEMGFNRSQAMFALRNTNNNIERAVDWIFGHQDELMVIQTDADLAVALEAQLRRDAPAPSHSSPLPAQRHGVSSTPNKQQQPDAFNAMDYAPQPPSGGVGADVASAHSAAAPLNDGAGLYHLKAFISHMGPNTSSGHYVCHIKKDGQWIIYNDEKVAKSEKPPRDLAYLYLFERADS